MIYSHMVVVSCWARWHPNAITLHPMPGHLHPSGRSAASWRQSNGLLFSNLHSVLSSIQHGADPRMVPLLSMVV